jgi:autotransporter-associated beta strand protein
LNGQYLGATNPVIVSGSGAAGTLGALTTISGGGGMNLGYGNIGVNNLVLAGDTVIGANSSNWQLGKSGLGLSGNGYALTKLGSTLFYVWQNATTSPSQVTIGGGSVYFCENTNALGSASITLTNNGGLDTWNNNIPDVGSYPFSSGNPGLTIHNNLTVGIGGGRLINDSAAYNGSHANYDTYRGTVTLNANLTIANTATRGGGIGRITLTGPISGSGGIICNQATTNITALSGASTYTGPTVLNSGILQLSTIQQGGGTYTNLDGVTLDVPNQSGSGTLPMSALVLGSASGSTLSLSRVTALSTTTPLITATNLTLNGTITVTLAPGLYATAGQYPLIKYTGSISGGGSLVVGSASVRGSASISNNVANNSIDLVIPGANPVFWVGNVSTNWDINTTANFKYLGSATTYQQSGVLGDAVTFDDSTTKTNVFLTTPLSPTVVLVNTTNTYTFSGTNLTGASSLVKNGTGTLVLSNLNNNFTAGAFVGNGTLRMSFTTNASLFNNYAGPVTVASGGTLDMGSNNPTAMTVNISGSGVGGNGALQGNYSGGGAAIGPSIVNLLTNATIGGNNRLDIRSGSKTLSAANPNTTLTKVGAGYVGLVAATVNTNVGDITILGGTLSYQTSTAGLGGTNNTIYVGGSGTLGFYAATVPLVKNIVFSNGASILVESGNTVGQNVFAGPVRLDGGTMTVKGNYYNGLYFSNSISGPGSLALQYQSYVYLAASNTLTGTITVPNCGASNGGRGTRLSFIGNGSAMTANQIYLQGIVSGQPYAGWISMDTPSGVLTLGTNQQLRGDNGAYVRGSVVAPAGSSLAVGQAGNTNYQYMIIGTNLTLQGGSTNYMAIYKTATLTTNSQLYVTNALTLGGTLVIATNGAVTPLVAGDSFKLYFAGGTSGAFTNVGPAPGPGLVWDTSALASSGTISVKAVSVSPTTTTIGYGNNPTLTASSTLSAPVNYQWFDYNTNAIVNATNAALTLTKPAVAASGNYSCVISKGGAVSTAVASLTVTQASLVITATNISKNFGTTYTFSGTEFVNSPLAAGDSLTSVSLSSAGAPSGATAGTYPIVPSAAVGTGLVNYSITYNNGTMTVVQTVNLTPTNIVSSISGSTLTLSWPADHIGWLLQSNSVSLANTNFWFNVPGSDTTNLINISLNPAQTNVFYRMKY